MSEANETTVPTGILPALLKEAALLAVAGVPGIALPPGWTHEEFPELLPTPQRTKSKVEAHEIGGFISYVNRFKIAATALYCTKDSAPSLLARIDDHQPGAPSHVEHTAVFPCPVTEEWARWFGQNGKRMDQQAFAEFIEDNLRDIVAPKGPDFLGSVTNFSENRKIEFRSAQRLDSGTVQFTLNETSGESQVKFPTELEIAVPVFMGVGTRYAIKCRVKYRLNNGGLSMWFEMDRPDLVKKAAYVELIEQVEKETGLSVHRAI